MSNLKKSSEGNKNSDFVVRRIDHHKGIEKFQQGKKKI